MTGGGVVVAGGGVVVAGGGVIVTPGETCPPAGADVSEPEPPQALNAIASALNDAIFDEIFIPLLIIKKIIVLFL